jgi:hypothetical protein
MFGRSSGGLRPALFVGTFVGLLSAAHATSWPVPLTTPGEDGWETYVDAPALDPASAAGVMPGQESAEAALVHFYASWLRGDEEYLAAVPPEGQRHPDYGAVLEAMAGRSFRSFRLVARKSLGEEAVLVRFQLEALSRTASSRPPSRRRWSSASAACGTSRSLRPEGVRGTLLLAALAAAGSKLLCTPAGPRARAALAAAGCCA